jgi:hypothetical protein
MSRATRAAENRKLARAWRAERDGLGTSACKQEYKSQFGRDWMPPAPTFEERRRTSFHEAGHAVYYESVGLSVEFVTALPYFDETKGWARGATVFQSRTTPISQLEGYVRGIAAGPVVSKMVASLIGINEGMGSNDYDQIIRLFTHQLGVSVSDPENLIAQIETEAAKKFQNPQIWKCLEEVAALLQIQDKVRGLEIRKILGRAAV